MRRASDLPDSEQGKIPDDDAPRIVGEAYRDLPIDADFGPYPVIVFVHGTAGYRYTSLPQMTHWASRGFVVLAADHPGLNLQDLLITACGTTAPSRATRAAPPPSAS